MTCLIELFERRLGALKSTQWSETKVYIFVDGYIAGTDLLGQVILRTPNQKLSNGELFDVYTAGNLAPLVRAHLPGANVEIITGGTWAMRERAELEALIRALKAGEKLRKPTWLKGD